MVKRQKTKQTRSQKTSESRSSAEKTLDSTTPDDKVSGGHDSSSVKKMPERSPSPDAVSDEDTDLVTSDSNESDEDEKDEKGVDKLHKKGRKRSRKDKPGTLPPAKKTAGWCTGDGKYTYLTDLSLEPEYLQWVKNGRKPMNKVDTSVIGEDSEILAVSSDEEDISSEPIFLPSKKTIAKENIGYTLKTGLLAYKKYNRWISFPVVHLIRFTGENDGTAGSSRPFTTNISLKNLPGFIRCLQKMKESQKDFYVQRKQLRKICDEQK